ncbi:peptidoglycan-binding protein [Actinobacteria bacterium YIM 96077]|uniref:Peptidoglycan-binding protein n=2 Tax=Phytoactinopolyspora halophila TaxID=1981511 RepID=A0A329R2J6_9ACTN|nr:peptidoglycan-binding protein [Actinobacteria bacterium YIM 96077]RAW18189.1 peptidoglycan-binding protein [Phytoactinopolyspora halophila]
MSASVSTPNVAATVGADLVFQSGDEGDDVRELQARLTQLGWYASGITGTYDAPTADAVSGFQDRAGLEPTGDVDPDTWDELLSLTREPTEDEMDDRVGPPILSPGDSGDQVRELQARLAQLDWFTGDVTPNYGDMTSSAVAGFQEKRGLPATGTVDQQTWDQLTGLTRQPSDDEMHNRPPEDDDGEDGDGGDSGVLDPRCTTGRVMCIDKTTNSLRWVVDGAVQMTFDVRFGAELTPTREGAFDVGWKSRDHVSSLYDTPMPYAMFFSGGQAVHYSPDFAANGYDGASHGCVNVRDEAGIASLFEQVQVGDKVIVYRS